MNGVLGMTRTLLDTPLNQDQRKTVEAIRDSGDSLLRILNDILDFSKLDSGRMELEEAPFSPATLTENPIGLLGPAPGRLRRAEDHGDMPRCQFAACTVG